MFNLKNFLKKYNLFMLFLIVIILWGFFGAITSGGFLSSRNISNLFRQMSITGILSIGMSFVIITANIDLSVGSMLGLLGGIAGILLRTGLNSTLTIIITLIFGFIIGAINGFWVAYRKVPAFIVTLAGLLAYRGVVLYITKGQTLAMTILVIANTRTLKNIYNARLYYSSNARKVFSTLMTKYLTGSQKMLLVILQHMALAKRLTL